VESLGVEGGVWSPLGMGKALASSHNRSRSGEVEVMLGKNGSVGEWHEKRSMHL